MKDRAVLRPLGADQHQGPIRRSSDSGSAANSIQWIVVLHFPKVVDDQNCQVVMVGKALEQRQVVVVTAVADIGSGPHLLQRVNNNQSGVWVAGHKLMELFEQPSSSSGIVSV